MKLLGKQKKSKALIRLIENHIQEHPDMSRSERARQLEKIMSKKRMRPIQPETLERRISEVKKSHKDFKLDSIFNKPWSLGCLGNKDLPIEIRTMPAEVIPILLDICEERRRRGILRTLTIGEAFWVSKLYHVIKSPRVTIRAYDLTMTDLLYRCAHTYTLWQTSSEIYEEPYDTSELDFVITNYPEQYFNNPWVFGGGETKQEICELVQLIDEKVDAENAIEELKNKYTTSGSYSKQDKEKFKKAIQVLIQFDEKEPNLISWTDCLVVATQMGLEDSIPVFART